MRTVYVYIVSTASGKLLVGYTDDIRRDIYARSLQGSGSFLEILVYYEVFSEARLALDRYVEVKNLSKYHQLKLIKLTNPSYEDLSLQWQYGRL